MKAWRFSERATDNVENFVGAKVYEIRKKLDVGGKLSREEKNWVAEKLNNNLYSKMIKYAHDNKIQIRSWFTETYNKDTVEVYTEAYDLEEINEDFLKWINKEYSTKPLEELENYLKENEYNKNRNI